MKSNANLEELMVWLTMPELWIAFAILGGVIVVGLCLN